MPASFDATAEQRQLVEDLEELRKLLEFKEVTDTETVVSLVTSMSKTTGLE